MKRKEDSDLIFDCHEEGVDVFEAFKLVAAEGVHVGRQLRRLLGELGVEVVQAHFVADVRLVRLKTRVKISRYEGVLCGFEHSVSFYKLCNTSLGQTS